MTAKLFDIVLLTQAAYVRPETLCPYVENVLLEDKLLAEALQEQGFKVTRAAWDDPDFDWSSSSYALFRATWDYFHRIQEFQQWLHRVKDQTQFLNSQPLILWSSDKHYLADLAAQGLTIPPTEYLPRGRLVQLSDILAAKGWRQAILKPVIAGGARHTYFLDAANLDSHQDLLQSLLEKEDMMLQEYQQQITTKGEISFMVFGGRYSHAVLKKPKSGDFRVQDDFGGSVHPYTASAEEIAFAERAVACCQEQPLYARVDVMWNNQNELCLSELELIEPELWFRMDSQAASRLVEVLKSRIR